MSKELRRELTWSSWVCPERPRAIMATAKRRIEIIYSTSARRNRTPTDMSPNELSKSPITTTQRLEVATGAPPRH
eukprot:1391905-Pyramimonas_sp.AAC.1